MIYQREFRLERAKIARDKDALGRLRANPTDAVALMALYETYGRELQEVAVRHFGKNQLAKKAVLNLLVAVASRARTCDLRTMQTKEWIVQCADIEATRLRDALDTRLSIDPPSAIRPLGGGYNRSFGEEAGQDQLGPEQGTARHERRRRGSAK